MHKTQQQDVFKCSDIGTDFRRTQAYQMGMKKKNNKTKN